MSRYSLKKQRYKKYLNSLFILDILNNKIMKNGEKTKSKKCVLEVFKKLSSISKQNSFFVFLKALQNVSPRIRACPEYSFNTFKVIFVKEQLIYSKSIKLGISILLKNCNKQKGLKFSTRLALEILDAFAGKGLSVKKKNMKSKKLF